MRVPRAPVCVTVHAPRKECTYACKRFLHGTCVVFRLFIALPFSTLLSHPVLFLPCLPLPSLSRLKPPLIVFYTFSFLLFAAIRKDAWYRIRKQQWLGKIDEWKIFVAESCLAYDRFVIFSKCTCNDFHQRVTILFFISRRLFVVIRI